MGHGPGVVEEGGVAEIARGKFRDPGLGSRRTRGEGPRSVRPTAAPLFPREWGGGEVVRGKGETGSPPPRPSDRLRGSDHLVAQTNPPVRGRVSADRSEEAAQPLTTPRLVRKSSTDDSVRLHCMWGLRAFGRCDAGFPRRRRVPLAWAEKGRLEAVP